MQMTDNEKRAHDLAVAVSIEICRAKANSQISSCKSVVNVDYFAEYMNIYENTIKAFDKHFPDGK
jgi:hypothetical protein